MSEAATESAPVSVRVVLALAEAADTDPVDLHPPLSSVVDADALDRLAASEFDASVEFEYQGRSVVVTGDGEVEVGEDTAVPAVPPGQ